MNNFVMTFVIKVHQQISHESHVKISTVLSKPQIWIFFWEKFLQRVQSNKMLNLRRNGVPL